MAAGIISADLVGKAFGKITGALRDTIGLAAEAEKANQGLDAALFTTGRTTAQLGDHFKNYADQLMRSTVYDDEVIKGAQAMLLQLTSLDKDGIDRATKGVIGLATVFRMDLGSASELIARWMEGNTDRIKKYGIHVDETASKEKQQAQILDQLNIYYQRAELATGTYGGALVQLKNTFSEVGERIGTAVTENETFQKTIKAIREELQFMIDSGQAEKWAENLSKAFSLAVLAGKGFYQMLKEGPMGMGGVLAEQIVNPMGKIHEEAKKNVKIITEFRDTLKWIKPSIGDMAEAIEGGAKSWGEYRYKIAQADEEFDKNKKTLGGWMDKAFGIIGINTKIAKSFDVSTKGNQKFGDGLKEIDPLLAKATGSAGELAKVYMIATMPALVETESAYRHMGMVADKVTEQMAEGPGYVSEAWRKALEDELRFAQDFAAAADQVFGDFSRNVLDAFYQWGEGSKPILKGIGQAFEDLGKQATKAMGDMLTKVITDSAREILATQMVAIAHAIKSVMQSIPFPLNLILAGVAIAGVSALFHKIKLAEGAIFHRPTIVPGLAGRSYELAEGPEGVEIAAPPSKIREAIFGGRESAAMKPSVTHIHNHIYIAGHEIREEIIKIVNMAAGRRQLNIPSKVIA